LPPSFFRSRLTTDTLDLGYILPTAGRVRDFHPLERALTGRTNKALSSKPDDSALLLFYSEISSGIRFFTPRNTKKKQIICAAKVIPQEMG